MGWTTYHKDAGRKASDEVRDMLTWESETTTSRCLDVAIVKLRTAYAAVEHTDKATGERYVWAAVFLLGYYPNDYYNFGYKDMEESMGPNESDCPERILKLLTDYPSLNDWARDWRKRCWDNVNKRKSTPQIKVGRAYALEYAVSFVDGAKLRELFVADRRGSVLICTPIDNAYRRYRVPRNRFNGAKEIAA